MIKIPTIFDDNMINTVEKISLSKYVKEEKKSRGDNCNWEGTWGCAISVSCDCGWIFTSCNIFGHISVGEDYVACPYCNSTCLVHYSHKVYPFYGWFDGEKAIKYWYIILLK